MKQPKTTFPNRRMVKLLEANAVQDVRKLDLSIQLSKSSLGRYISTIGRVISSCPIELDSVNLCRSLPYERNFNSYLEPRERLYALVGVFKFQITLIIL